MSTPPSNNPFRDPRVAQDWITKIESESAQVRENDIYPRLREWVNRFSPTEILEIGSGQGVCSDQVDLEDRKYTGLDSSHFLLARAKQLYPFDNRTFVEGDACEIPFQGASFDAAFSVAVLHLLEDLEKAVSEMARVLKPNGHFFIITANPDAYSLWTDSYSDIKLVGKRFEGSTQLPDQTKIRDILYLHTGDEIELSLSSAGLVIQSLDTFRTTQESGDQRLFICFQGYKPLAK